MELTGLVSTHKKCRIDEVNQTETWRYQFYTLIDGTLIVLVKLNRTKPGQKEEILPCGLLLNLWGEGQE